MGFNDGPSPGLLTRNSGSVRSNNAQEMKKKKSLFNIYIYVYLYVNSYK